MVFRKIPLRFCKENTKPSATKYIINEPPHTFSDQVYPQIPFKIRAERYRIKTRIGPQLQHQLYALTFAVSDLFRDERIVLNYNRACEVRPQVERLIVEAMRNGDRHRPTMALANYWLREKNLVHKLFKVFVPRYEDYSTAFTALHMLGKDYEKHGMTLTEMKQWRGTFFKKGEAVLEMRGNELPPIIRPRPSTSGWLNNVLISSHLKFKKQEAIAAAATPATEKQL